MKPALPKNGTHVRTQRALTLPQEAPTRLHIAEVAEGTALKGRSLIPGDQ